MTPHEEYEFQFENAFIKVLQQATATATAVSIDLTTAQADDSATTTAESAPAPTTRDGKRLCEAIGCTNLVVAYGKCTRHGVRADE